LKTPDQIHFELSSAIAASLPRGFELKIAITKSSGNPNWVAGVGNLPAEAKTQYQAKLLALRKSDPAIDWQGG
jgi:hypothetical protein